MFIPAYQIGDVVITRGAEGDDVALAVVSPSKGTASREIRCVTAERLMFWVSETKVRPATPEEAIDFDGELARNVLATIAADTLQ